MTVTHHRAATARHEAGHVAAMVMAGRLPKRVTADWPHPDSFGVMEVDWGNGIDRAGALDVAVAILLGPLGAPTDRPWPPEWPPDRDVPGDEGQLAACCRYLDLGEADYYSLVRQAHTIARGRDFARLRDLIARALDLKDELDADDLRWLVGSETLIKYGIQEKEEDHAS